MKTEPAKEAPAPAPAASPPTTPAPSGKALKDAQQGLGMFGTGAGGGGIGARLGPGAGIGSIGTKGRGGGSVNYGSGVGAAQAPSGSSGTLMQRKNMAFLSGKRDTSLEDKPSTSDSEPSRKADVNPFVTTAEDRLSTFAVDVDTASYTMTRRSLMEGALPSSDAVRVEELLNYFRYTYPEPTPSDGPFAVHMDAAPSPFTPKRHLLRVGVQGKRLSISERKPAHLTFLVDVSGSMGSPDRLPLAQRALRMLVDNLRDGDTVALVTYAGNVRRVLGPTGMERKALIHSAIEDLTAGGSTAMGSGIELAYQEAMKTLDGASFSRVIVLSDGDANVGRTSHEDILKTIQGHVKEGITLTTVGFGMGNYKDTTMEQLANKGNGNYFYVDSLMAARRIFQEQLGGTLEVIAQDVKLQVDFDPEQVARYRLVGYENRNIADRDFRDDKVDAGELGSGHTVTALYELELKPGAGAGLATVRVRAKKPRGVNATERAHPFQAGALANSFKDASVDLRFATAVMGAAELLRKSPHAENWSLETVREIARAATPAGNAEREEFLALLEKARPLLRGVAAR
ncbi:vWA domain-containing protein [Corallococcus terminator]